MSDTALTTLRNMCEQGALYIITPHHLCDESRPIDSRMDETAHAHCQAWSETWYSVKDPRHFERRAVTRIEGPDDKGRYRGYADDGSFTEGYPEALLRRLMETALAG